MAADSAAPLHLLGLPLAYASSPQDIQLFSCSCWARDAPGADPRPYLTSGEAGQQIYSLGGGLLEHQGCAYRLVSQLVPGEERAVCLAVRLDCLCEQEEQLLRLLASVGQLGLACGQRLQQLLQLLRLLRAKMVAAELDVQEEAEEWQTATGLRLLQQVSCNDDAPGTMVHSWPAG